MDTIMGRKMSTIAILIAIIMVTICCSTTVKATPLSVFDDWTIFADDGIGDAYGGTSFEAEYLFYKSEGDILSIGLQTKFDVDDGKIRSNGRNYYAGDLALSFDGDVSGPGGSGYEYAADFGLFTKDYRGSDKVSYKQSSGRDTGRDDAGLYGGITWRNDLLHTDAAPFAMDYSTTGKIEDALVANDKGKVSNSYFRKVSFDTTKISAISSGGEYTVHAHWTMNCGNDEIGGHFGGGSPKDVVPEPATIALLGIGLVGLAGGVVRRRLKKTK